MTRTSLAVSTALALILSSALAIAQAPGDEPIPVEDPAAQPEPRADVEPVAPADPPMAMGPAQAEPDDAPLPQAEPPTPDAPQGSAQPPQAPSTLQVPEAEAVAPQSWFHRDPLTMKFGRRLSLTLYGVVEANLIYDTTRSYGDSISANLVAREDTYAGNHGRFQASMRSTRFGLAVEAKTLGGVTPSAVIEADFSGDVPTSDTGSSEANYYDSPSLRLRYAYMNMANPYLDVLFGQTDDVFGWQNTPNSVSRHTQFRLSHTFGATSPVGLDIAAAALRPAQRDSQVPDGQAGIRLNVNSWQGVYTRNGIPTSRPLSLGVSGAVRQFDVDAFTPPPTQSSNKVVGWGMSIDALLPVIPAEDENDRGNRLTFAGSFITGTGIGDLMRLHGGAKFPPLPNPARASPPPEFDPNIDDGIVTFDRLGVLHTIDWQAFRLGAQYYLPPSGRVRLAVEYIQAYSKNMSELYPLGGEEIELLTHVADRIRYLEGNIFWDITPELRAGVAGIYTMVEYLDGEDPHNIRTKLTGKYFF